MSNVCAFIVQRRRVGSSTKKAVMMYLADRASDDGSGIWTSKSHIAADTELSKRSVQNAMNDFENDGLLEKVGTKPCQNGYTYEYRLILTAIEALPGTRESTGAGDSPVQEIHLTGAGDSPQDVQEIHPNHPITIHEPSNTPLPPEGDDLFSANEEQETQRDSIEEGFNEFWDKIWPSHKRKMAKKDCHDVYRAACTGKHRKADKIDPATLNRAARSYIASLNGDLTYLKGTLPWLRQPGWEPFITAPDRAGVPEADLTPRQREMLRDGRVPPSMSENGKPNAAAAYWLKHFGHGVQA
ncbi:MAG: hypothetical protein EP341_00330 [Sphingomonadales bacterium]|nr:MAG: hypothetical protein EP341_00330 [Sphingomonadales bacterium]